MGNQTRVPLALWFEVEERLGCWKLGLFMKEMSKKQMADAASRHRNGDGNPLGANSEIARKLKQYYDELVSDRVPDRFAQLLSQLEQTEPAQKKD